MKRKLFSLAICLALIFSLTVPALAAQSQSITVDPINVMVGGKIFLPTDVNGNNVPVFAYNGTTYAPLRALAEAYGLTVGYDSAKQLATVSGTPSTSFAGSRGTAQALTERTSLTVFSINIEVNGEVFRPKDVNGNAVSVFAYNGTTYAPLRALAEAYGLTVGYDSDRQLATVGLSAEPIAATDYASLVASVSAARRAELSADTCFDGYLDYLVNDFSTLGLISEDEMRLLTNSNVPMVQTVTYAEAVSDIDLLFRALRVCYGAYYYFGQDAYDHAEQEVLSWLQGQSTISVSELRDVLRESLSFMVDAHSFVGYDVDVLGNIRYKYHDCLEQLYEQGEQGFFKLINGERLDFVSFSDARVTMEPTLLESGKIVYSPVLFCPKEQVASSTVTLRDSSGNLHTEAMQFRVSPDYSFSREIEYHLLQENGVAYLSLRSFDTEMYSDTLAKFQTSGTTLRDSKAIIFDLRGNSGGSESPIFNWAYNLTGEHPVLREAQANRYSIFNASTNYSYFTLNHINAGKWIPNDIPILVLVDDCCASAGESALNILKTMDNVLVIGSNSSGYQLGGNAVRMTLPNTSIDANIGTQLRFFFDMENVDCTGYTPDLWCRPDTALDAVLNMLTEYGIADNETADALRESIEADKVRAPSSITIVSTNAQGQATEFIGHEHMVGEQGVQYFSVFYNGEMTTDFEVFSSAPTFCAAEKAADGRIKVTANGYGCAVITVQCDGVEQVFLFSCQGNEYSGQPDADPAIWLDWPATGYTELRPDGIIGSDGYEHRFLVMVNGKQATDFTVSVSGPDGCSAVRAEDGRLIFRIEASGYYGITVRVGAVERTFLFWAHS